MRISATTQIRSRWAIVFLVAWNAVVLAVLIIFVPPLVLFVKTRMTLGIIAHLILGLVGGVQILGLLSRACGRR